MDELHAPQPPSASGEASAATRTLPVRSDRATLGRLGEDVAAGWLAARGWWILDRNWRPPDAVPRGEIDIVARDPDGALVVVEVKTRRGVRHGGPFLAVTPSKVEALRGLALAYARTCDRRHPSLRVDVIGVRVTVDGGALVELRRGVG